MQKYNGSNFAILEAPQIKQVGGRAGRYRTAQEAEGEPLADTALSRATQNLGLITTLEEPDLSIVRKAMHADPEPIMSAGIFPPTDILMDFAAFFPPDTSFSYIMMRLHELSLIHPRYKLCSLREQIGIADTIQPVKGLTVKDRIILCASPCDTRDKNVQMVITAFARCIGEKRSGALLDIPELELEILDEEMTVEGRYLERLEVLHKALILYLWLSYRFTGVFESQKMAFYVKGLVEERIDKMLTEFSASAEIQRMIQRKRKQALARVQQMQSEEQTEQESETVVIEEDQADKLYLSEAESFQTPNTTPEPEAESKQNVQMIEEPVVAVPEQFRSAG